MPIIIFIILGKPIKPIVVPTIIFIILGKPKNMYQHLFFTVLAKLEDKCQHFCYHITLVVTHVPTIFFGL